jgi:hypothetical protein
MSNATGPEHGTPLTGPAPDNHSPRPVRRPRRILTIAVAGLGILNFLLGFAPYDSTDGTEVPGMGTVGAVSGNFFQSGTGGVATITLLFAAGVIAGCGLLPKQTPNLPTIVGLSIAGLLMLLLIMINFPDRVDAGIGLILVLFSGFAQATAAVAALLLRDDQ